MAVRARRVGLELLTELGHVLTEQVAGVVVLGSAEGRQQLGLGDELARATDEDLQQLPAMAVLPMIAHFTEQLVAAGLDNAAG